VKSFGDCTDSDAEHEERSRDYDEDDRIDPIQAKDRTGVLPSSGTRCAEHTWGDETNPETTEGDSRGTSATICRHRLAPATQCDRAPHPAGETHDTVRINNDALTLAAEVAKAGEHPEVILEASYGWY
jgi:hypothetical protein